VTFFLQIQRSDSTVRAGRSVYQADVSYGDARLHLAPQLAPAPAHSSAGERPSLSSAGQAGHDGRQLVRRGRPQGQPTEHLAAVQRGLVWLPELRLQPELVACRPGHQTGAASQAGARLQQSGVPHADAAASNPRGTVPTPGRPIVQLQRRGLDAAAQSAAPSAGPAASAQDQPPSELRLEGCAAAVPVGHPAQGPTAAFGRAVRRVVRRGQDEQRPRWRHQHSPLAQHRAPTTKVT
jgi:hypothetical protein